MDSLAAALACCFLLGLAVAQTEKADFTITSSSPSGFNLSHTTTFVPPSDTTVKATANTTASEDTTQPTVTTGDNETTTHRQTSQSTTNVTPLTNSTSLTTTPAANHTSTSPVQTVPPSQSTAYQSSTPDTAVTTTATSSHTVNNTVDSDDRTTHGSGLNISERNMTIVFSVGLGAFAVALVIFMFHRCKQKVQYLHQPFNNTDDPDEFVADNDTLVISGGLYDGHPIYDNVPTGPEDQSQFRLEFLH